MARARNIKPGFFKNADLVELPMEARLLFIGLWTLADRAGRLEDRPKQIKMELFPADPVDIDGCLDGLQRWGFITRYEVEGRKLLQVVNFTKHQNPHKEERVSALPSPDETYDEDPKKTRPSTVQAPCKNRAKTEEKPCKRESSTVQIGLIPDSLIPDSGFLIPDSRIPDCGSPVSIAGRDVVSSPALTPPPAPRRKAEAQDTPLQAACRETWQAYCDAYFRRYGTEPVRNAKVNSQVKQLCQALPHDEAPGVAAFYVGHNDAFYVRKGHDIGLLVTDAVKLRMEWATGRQMTGMRARQEERAGSMMGILDEIKRERGEA